MNNFKWTALILAAIFAGPTLAGVVLEIETTDHRTSPPAVETIRISAQGKLLMADLGIGSGEGRVIYRGDRSEMVVVDHSGKSYFTLDKKKVAAMAGQANQMMMQMEQALENVPEEQRAAVEQMMKQRMPQGASKGPETEVRKTADSAEKNGYPCVRYEVLRDGHKINEIWVTEWTNIEGAAEVAEAFGDMGDFIRELTQVFQGAMGGGAGALPSLGQELFSQLSKLGGFPVFALEYADDGSLRGESNLRSAQPKKIDPTEFEPPDGYKPNMMFGG